MTYDLNKYRRVIKPVVINWLDANKDKPILDQIPKISLATNCPLVVVSHLVGEVSGYTAELNTYIDRLTKYYHVDSVIGHEHNKRLTESDD